ncbi:MAG: sigma-70 family RNA polymerase sigma factor [Opitutaceae bacterium]
MSSIPPEQSRWFLEQVHPHEAVLRAWLSSRFPTGCDIDDIIQESYIRILRAHECGELHSPKAFLFATARNMALDYFRHRRVVGEKSLVDYDVLSVLDEGDAIPKIVDRKEELIFLTEAIQSLPDRCRQVFTLRKLYGMSQQEIAQRLGISASTVSAQLTIGLHKCTEYFSQHRRERKGSHE